MNRVDQLHSRPNGLWSETMAELNKLLFMKAYIRKVDEVTMRKALKEAEEWIEGEGRKFDEDENSPLLSKWLNNPPQSDEDWKWWIAVHQRHLFLPLNRRGAFYSGFPALSEKSRRPCYKLTVLFFEALKKKVSTKTPSS